MQRSTLMALLAGGIILTAADASFARVRVAELGDPADFVFEGVASFPLEQVRRQLAGDFDFLLAAHPNAPLQPMLEAIESKLTLGYQSNGFPHVTIKARYDEAGDCIVVSVTEGPQYLRGEIHFVGADNVETAPIIERLTQRHVALPALPTSAGEAWTLPSVIRAGVVRKDENGSDKTEKPIWVAGKPASFDEISNRSIITKVNEALSLQAYFFPEVSVEVSPDGESRTGVLTVTIHKTGPRAILGEIEVQGANKHSADEILEFVGLRPGMVFDMSVHADVERRLWDSGRFLHHEAALVPPKVVGESVRLQLRLREYDDAPPLGQEFSTVEKVMLKLGDWLSEWVNSGDDMLIKVSELPVDDDGNEREALSQELILSPRNGFYFDITLRDSGARTLFQQSLALTKSRWTLISRETNTKFDADFEDITAMSFYINFLGQPDNPDGRRFRTFFGFGFGNRDDQSPAELKILFAPVVGINWARLEQCQYKIENDVLHIAGDSIDVRIDARSGRLLKCSSRLEDFGYAFEVRFAPDGLQQRLKQIDQETAEYRNAYEPQALLGSAFTYLLEEAIHYNFFNESVEDTAAQSAVKRLLTRRVLRNIDAVARGDTPDSSENNEFSIPAGLPENEQQQRSWMEMIAREALPYYSQLFPRDSPPWIAGREFAFLVSGRAKYADYEFKKILNSHYTGPVTHLYVGSLLRIVNPHAARPFALRGLRKLDAADFRHDYEVFLDEDGVVGKLLIALAEELRTLDDDEIKALAEAYVRPEHQADVQQHLRGFRDAEQPVREALPKLLDALWKLELREHVKHALERLQDAGVIENALKNWGQGLGVGG